MKYIGFQNGIFLQQDKIKVSVHDRGYLYGETLFETCLWTENKCEYFDEHWDRWQYGMKLMKLSCLYDKEALQQIVSKVVEQNKVSTGIIRWTISYDQLNKQSNICLTVRECIRNKSHYSDGISLKVSAYAKPDSTPFHLCKHGNYLLHMQELRNAQAEGFDDVLFLNHHGYVAETAIANIFWKKDEVLYTPSIDTGVLPGIMRGKIIEKYKIRGILVREGKYKIEELLQANEVFITNCVRKVLSVRNISFEQRNYTKKINDN